MIQWSRSWSELKHLSLYALTLTYTFHLCTECPFFWSKHSQRNGLIWLAPCAYRWNHGNGLHTVYACNANLLAFTHHWQKKRVSNKGHSVENSPNDFPIFDSFVSLTSMPRKCSTLLHEANSNSQKQHEHILPKRFMFAYFGKHFIMLRTGKLFFFFALSNSLCAASK